MTLLPVISKLYEKLLLNGLKPLIEEKRVIPTHQIAFIKEHEKKDKVHIITNQIEKASEERRISSKYFCILPTPSKRAWNTPVRIQARTT